MPLPVIGAALGGAATFSRALGAYLFVGFGYAASSVFQKAVLALGLTFVSYLGVESFLEVVEDTISNGLLGLPGIIVQALSAMGVFDALSLIFSAVASRVAVAGASVVFKRGVPPGA